jgi:hypothetical protein
MCVVEIKSRSATVYSDFLYFWLGKRKYRGSITLLSIFRFKPNMSLIPKLVVAFSFTVFLKSNFAYAQCEPGQIHLSMNIYTDPWGYETYWEIVPGTNPCGEGTIVWGSNLEAVGCSGGGETNSYGTETAYPSNTVVQVDNICLNAGELYTLYFVDDWGDGGLYFEMFQDGVLTGIYAGTGIGNAWTFEAGLNALGPYDSPCNAALVTPGLSSALDLNNSNCYTQVNEIHPFLGHCTASGAWCADDVTKTLWARFTVPDEESYEISTVHNGTYINTQIAVWVADDCSNPESFMLVAANDDFWGESGIEQCPVEIPECVNKASAAFENVISQLPACCASGWTQECQDLYDGMSLSCNSGSASCSYLLEGFDSYGDGWNDSFITVTINGESADYTFYEGIYQSWPLELSTGDDISITFTPMGYPEEVTVALMGPDGVYELYIQPFNLDPLLYEQEINCNGEVVSNPWASRCFINCLPAGTECYIQVDGYGGESGDFVLTVKPYTEEPQIYAEVTDLICPVGVGTIAEGLIVTFIDGWGLNYLPTWTASNGYFSNEYHPSEIMNGVYELTAIDACGHEIEASYEVLGPEPFVFSSAATSTCPENTDGAVSTQFAGGNGPYDFFWLLPDSTQVESLTMSNLPAGVYQFHVTDTVGCAIIETAVVQELASPVFDLGESFTVCDEFMVMLEGPENMVDYEWSEGSQTQNALLSDESFSLGSHLISLHVINEFGCAYTDELSMEVIECTAVFNEVFDSVILYPQPANQYLMLKGLPAFDVSLTITDIAGRRLAGYNSGGNTNFEVPTAHLNAGCYVLSLSNHEQLMNLTFVITH